MKNVVLASRNIASLAVISQPFLVQDDPVFALSEETGQAQGEREKLPQPTKQERKARRIAAIRHFESLSEKEQAELPERRQQRCQARRRASAPWQGIGG